MAAVELPTCASAADVARLDGRRVVVEGTYRAVVVARRPAAPRLDRPGPAQLELADRSALLLEVYHQPAGARAAVERRRLDGRRVRAIGTVFGRTPTQVTAEGIPVATMTGPYLGAVEGLELADP